MSQLLASAPASQAQVQKLPGPRDFRAQEATGCSTAGFTPAGIRALLEFVEVLRSWEPAAPESSGEER